VNIITGISLLGILVGSAALIIVLSAFNGLENLVRGFYQDFDPDLKILPAEGKFFAAQPVEGELKNFDFVSAYSAVLEEKALFNFREKDNIATLKGVDTNYLYINNLEEHLPFGNYYLDQESPIPTAVIGAGVAYYLGFGRSDFQEPVNVFIPKEIGQINEESFRSDRIYPMAIFSVQPEFDEEFLLCRLDYAQKLLGREGKISGLEIALSDEISVKQAQEKIQEKLGPEFVVKSRDELQAAFLKVMRTEGLFTFLIFTLILGIATFTIAGSLTMIMFEKRNNLFTLWSMGTPLKELRQIILQLGLIISLSGGLIGIFLGSLVVFAQEHFEWISVGEGYIVDAYPVALQLQDVFLVGSTVILLGLLSSWLSARRLTLKLIQS